VGGWAAIGVNEEGVAEAGELGLELVQSIVDRRQHDRRLCASRGELRGEPIAHLAAVRWLTEDDRVGTGAPGRDRRRKCARPYRAISCLPSSTSTAPEATM